MKTQTAMATAFETAGYTPPETPADCLKRMMREAITAGGGKADASRDHFLAALAKANDPALLWELFAPVRAAIIGRLFTETLIEMRAERALTNAGEAGYRAPQGHGSCAEPAPKTEDAAISSEPEGQCAPAASSVLNAAAGAIKRVPQGQPNSAPAAAPPQRPSRVRTEMSAQIARLSVLRTFRKIGNKPLSEVTGLEARSWLKDHQRDGRFVSLVSYNVPDEVKIGAMVPEDEADRLYKLATEAGNA